MHVLLGTSADQLRCRSMPLQAAAPGCHNRAMTDRTQAGHGHDGQGEAQDEGLRQGELELLGVVAYGELAAFDRLADDARLAPELSDRVRMSGIAVAQFEHFRQVSERIEELGADPLQVMEPYHRPIDEFHELTRPHTWYEGLLKSYIGDGLAADFYREAAKLVQSPTRELINTVLADEGYNEFVIERVRAAIEADPDIGGRLALWGRRLVGEALSQSQRVIAERSALTDLLTRHATDRSLAEISQLTTRLVENHTARMGRLGLSS